MNDAPYTGGRGLVTKATAVAVIALALTLVGGFFDARRALWAYHFAFTYWAGIGLGALLVLGSFHATKARWPVVIRRMTETFSATGILFLVLFIPIAIGVKKLFPWADPQGYGLDGELLHLVEVRGPWLNVPFFLLRTGIYFALWIGFAWTLYRLSVRQDEEGGFALTDRQRRIAAVSLPLVGLAISFAAFDWQMSLDPHLSSTIFGVYYFSGSYLCALAVIILAAQWTRSSGLFGAYVSPAHFHSLGKLLLSFYCFWAYIAFSQYLLIWIANIPEEVTWYVHRNQGGWLVLGVFLVLFHFVVPFFILLSRDLKRDGRKLSVMAIWALVVHAVDVYWVMMPGLEPEAPSLHFTDLTALVGVGAAALAFVVWRMRGVRTVPVGDPYLADSLRYDPS
ncbi:MAG TPA: hypothetical protein VFK85_15580 [Anaeromyxobacteraceae bacterium]|nr:hypothetical protein [Anaeromyxobacteraceae bacterium]